MHENHTHYLIIGAGKFGSKAAARLRKKDAAAKITMVDQKPEALGHAQSLGVGVVCSDGVAYLIKVLETAHMPDWIIPAIPLHLAFEWVLSKTASHGLSIRAVPEEVAERLPNPVRGPVGQLYVSYADFICPDNCREPFERCTFTGKPRRGLLYRTIEAMSGKDRCSVVVRSRQLAPGVGGYRPSDLAGSLEEVLECRAPLVLLSTACLCHGVIHALSRQDTHMIQ
jgi:hypothetical protein